MATSEMPTMRSRRLGGELKRLRLEAGLKVQDVADALECGQPKISQIENGKRGIRPLDLTTFLNLVKVDDEQQRSSLRRLAKEIHKVDWFTGQGPLLGDTMRNFLTLETDSELVRAYEPHVIPGLLQTEAYMRQVFSVGTEPGAVQQKVETRLKRRELFERGKAFRLRIVLEAAVLHRIGGGPETVREQLLYLLETSKLINVSLQILAVDAAIPAGQPGPFHILTQRGEPPVDLVWLEYLTGGTLLEQRDTTQAYTGLWDDLTAAALSPSATQDYVRRMVKET